MNYDDFDDAGSQEKDNILYLYPLNDKFLSFISSRQTESVENTCKIIDYFTKKDKMNVTLKGASQGVDFITKMVGSTHGKNDTRLKNANINLFIDAPHIFQDEEKIVKRLRNGVQNKKNTIEKIGIYNDMGTCKHPACKTDNLIEWLKYYQRLSSNKVGLDYYWKDSNGETLVIDLTNTGPGYHNIIKQKVMDLTNARSNKQHTLN